MTDPISRILHMWHGWFFAVFLFCAALVIGNVLHYVIFRVLRKSQPGSSGLGVGLKTYLYRPARWIFLLTCILFIRPWIPIPASLVDIVHQGLEMALVVSLGWLAIGFVYVFENALVRRYDISVEDNIKARRVRTQTQVLRRILISLVIILDIGCLLWTFHDPQIWHYGTGLIASAGIASLVLATAAKSTASNFLAGIQIAFTEPIRIDDVVIVQGEWGRIEEITSAYVVVKIWDLRRLIVPLTYFIENPFQNWTRERANLLGTVFLYVDYSIPVEPLRLYLKSVLGSSPLWDKQVCSLQVTNITEHTVELRCLLSARNASEQFDLRCIVREKMLTYIQENYPDGFPRTRFSSVQLVPATTAAIQPQPF